MNERVLTTPEEKIEAVRLGAIQLVADATSDAHARLIIKRTLEVCLDTGNMLGTPHGTLCAMVFEAFINVAMPPGATDMVAFRRKMTDEINRLAEHGKQHVTHMDSLLEELAQMFPFLRRGG